MMQLFQSVLLSLKKNCKNVTLMTKKRDIFFKFLGIDVSQCRCILSRNTQKNILCFSLIKVMETINFILYKTTMYKVSEFDLTLACMLYIFQNNFVAGSK
jgi:hypothetical protein